MLTKNKKSRVIGEYKTHDADTGSAEVQIGLLTRQIKELADHLKKHSKDHHSRRGLLMMVGKRRRFMQFLQKNDIKKYEKLSKKLALDL
jgi:small subunit ribosomal protein S15